MLKAVRSRLTYANVVATGALFVALGGGAYALSGVPDRSGVYHGCVATSGALRVVAKASSCRKTKTVRRGRRRVRIPGESAISWNQKGAPGAPGAPGTPGTPGTPGPFPATLESGKTLTGAYRAIKTNAGDPVGDAETFTYPLVAKPTVHFIAPSAQPPTECPGTSANPQAAPGNLCVYGAQGNSGVSIANPETAIFPDASRFGFVVFDDFNGSSTSGTWAVTAP
jgi:hypothetical protein